MGDRGSFTKVVPCTCIDCALRHGDQAEGSELVEAYATIHAQGEELADFRRQVADLKARLHKALSDLDTLLRNGPVRKDGSGLN